MKLRTQVSIAMIVPAAGTQHQLLSEVYELDGVEAVEAALKKVKSDSTYLAYWAREDGRISLKIKSATIRDGAPANSPVLDAGF